MLLEACSAPDPDLRQCSLYGMGVIAAKSPDLFRPVAADTLRRIVAVVQDPQSRGERASGGSGRCGECVWNVRGDICPNHLPAGPSALHICPLRSHTCYTHTQPCVDLSLSDEENEMATENGISTLGKILEGPFADCCGMDGHALAGIWVQALPLVADHSEAQVWEEGGCVDMGVGGGEMREG